MRMEQMISPSIAIPDLTTPSLDSGLLQNKIFIHIDCMIDQLLFWKINIGFKYNKFHIKKIYLVLYHLQKFKVKKTVLMNSLNKTKQSSFIMSIIHACVIVSNCVTNIC